jgi:hypothetical protein
MPRRLLPFQVDSKWGYLDQNGKVVHEPLFDGASDFSDGLGHVDVNGELRIVDEDLRVLGKVPDSTSYVEFSDGLLVVTNPQTYKDRYVDEAGRDPFGKEFDCALSFSSNRAFAQVGDAWGMLDRSGNWVIEPSLKSATPFMFGGEITSTRRVGRKTYDLIDTAGRIVKETEFGQLRWVSDGLAPFGVLMPKGWRFGIADERGKEVVPPIYTECDYGFESKLLGVEVDDSSWGVIDRTGHWVIEPKFTYVGQCRSGLLVAYRGGKWTLNRLLVEGKIGFLKPDGATAIDFQFDGALPFHQGFAQVGWCRTPHDYDDMASGYVDATGRIIWRES